MTSRKIGVTEYFEMLEQKQDFYYGKVFWRAIAVLSLSANAALGVYLLLR